jgi:hypothetical protein
MPSNFIINKATRFLRERAGRVVVTKYVGQYGCINAAMSYVGWNRLNEECGATSGRTQ